MESIVLVRPALAFESAEPLYTRVPTRDEYGRCLGDFMMLFPGLRDRPGRQLSDVLGRIRAVLGRYAEVVFAEINLRLNLLWVSVRPRPGVILEIAAELKAMIPEALLVGEKCGS